MKRIIWEIGLLFLAIVVILNILFTANLDASEHITITFNSVIYILGIVAVCVGIFEISEIINKYFYNDYEKKKKLRKYIFIIVLVIYMLFTIVWALTIKTPIVGDSGVVCDLAQVFYMDNVEEASNRFTYAGISLAEYMQGYHQQIPLAFVYSIFFKIVHYSAGAVLGILNIISIALIVFSIFKISMHLSKKYETNNTLLLVLLLTFITIPMLSTFIYGDIPSLGLCLLSVYLMMKYTETKQIKYVIFASISTMVAYMLRMNSLIFIIATIIYLCLNLFNEFTKSKWKENLLKLLVIVAYIAISIVPSSLVKVFYLNKYNLDKNKAYPNISYFLMAMEEGPRANGWYKEERGEYALKNMETAKLEYIELIKERLNYFAKNIGYTFKFYTNKLASMWTENTYSAVRNNTVENKAFEWLINPLTFYQKALLIITCLCSFLFLIKNRKNLTLDVLFLLTIFIGGFMFHILWEAKSRYIIPYIVVLIPIASIKLINNALFDQKR